MENVDLDQPDEVIHTLTLMRDDGVLTPWSLTIAASDQLGRASIAVVVEDGPPDPPQHERVSVLASAVECFRGSIDEVRGIMLAHQRSGTTAIRGHDLAWRDALLAVSRAYGLVVHGVYAVTDDQVTPVVDPGT